MAKLKPRKKVWALNTGAADVYELTVAADCPSVACANFACDGITYTYTFANADAVDICIDVLERFTSIRLEPGQVGRVNLRTLKQVKLNLWRSDDGKNAGL